MRTRFVAPLIATLFSTCAAAGTVQIYSAPNQPAKTLTNAEHLIDVVAQPQLANSWWPGAVIGERQATAVARQQQQALITHLAAVAGEESGKDRRAIEALREQVKAITVTGRQVINLDPDTVRVSHNGNPRLQGEYSLWAGPRPDSITVFGLVSQPGKMPFTPGRDVARYLDANTLLSGADRSYAWVIYPDGRTQKVPVAYWNHRHVEPMPGSTIYVGFADALWSQMPDKLNADIVRALTQRVPE